MTKVYILTAGEYSDYHVVATYSTSELAAKAKADGLGDDILECPVDPTHEPVPPGLSLWYVEMDRAGNADGRVVDPYDRNHAYDKIPSHFVLKPDHEAAALHLGYLSFPTSMRATVWAKDLQHAAKILNEKRVQFIAEGKWPAAKVEA